MAVFHIGAVIQVQADWDRCFLSQRTVDRDQDMPAQEFGGLYRSLDDQGRFFINGRFHDSFHLDQVGDVKRTDRILPLGRF